jgi:hypothetical protein
MFTIAEFSGVLASEDPIDAAGGAFQDAGGPTTTPTVTLTTSHSADLVVSMGDGDIGTTSVGTISGVTATLISDGGGQGSLAQYGTSGAAGSVVVTDLPADDGWIIVAIALKAQVSAPNDVIFFGANE